MYTEEESVTQSSVEALSQPFTYPPEFPL